MESIENQAIEIYKNNIAYFSTSEPQLFKMLDVLGKAIENGDFIPKYDLEYLDGYFDVKEIRSGNYLYSGNSQHISEEFSKIVSFQKDRYAFEGLPVYRSTNLEKTDQDRTEMMEGILPVMDYYLEHIHGDDSMNSIEKFIFLGVALGLHIPIIDAKIDANEYLIIEDDLELFRLSLFVTDYKKLGEKAKLIFAVATDDYLFLSAIIPYLEDSFYNNRYLKYAHFPTHPKRKLKQIQNAILSQSFISFPYRIELQKALRPLEHINKGYQILNLSEHLQNSLFRDKPLLLVTAGPSLKKNIEWLKANHERFVIIAVSATLKTLYAHNITPSMVTHMDGFDAALAHFHNIPIKRFLKDAIVVLGPFVNPLVKMFFEKEHVYYYEEDTEYIKGYKGISAPCVGSFSLLFGLTLDVNELYLLGLDLAVDSQTGATHSEGHAYNEIKDMSQKDKISDTMSLRENLFPIQGNRQDIVYTNTLFNFSIQYLHNNMDLIKKSHQNIYNLGDGAYFYGTIPKDIAEVDVTSYSKIDKVALCDVIQKVLQPYATTTLSKADKESLQKRLEYSQEIGRKIALFSQSVSRSNVEVYLYDLLGMISEILTTRNRERNNIVQIYYSYFQNILPIVFDFFNTQGLKNKKQHIKRFNSMIVKEMKKIEQVYTKTLSAFLEGNQEDPKEAYSRFLLTLHNEVDRVKLANLYAKDGVGIMATPENLEDKAFIDSIRDLLVAFPQIKLKVFSFTQQETLTAKELFVNFANRVDFIAPANIYEVAQHIEIYFYNQGVIDRKVYMLLLAHSAQIVALDVKSINSSVREVDSLNKDHEIFRNFEKYGLVEQELAEYNHSYTKLIYERVAKQCDMPQYSIDLDSETFYKRERIELILNRNGYRIKLIENFLSKLLN